MLLFQLQKKDVKKIKCLSASTKQTCYFSPKYGVFSLVLICMSQDSDSKRASTSKLNQSDWGFYFPLLAQTGHITQCIAHLSWLCARFAACFVLVYHLQKILSSLRTGTSVFTCVWAVCEIQLGWKSNRKEYVYMVCLQESHKGTGPQSSQEPSWA